MSPPLWLRLPPLPSLPSVPWGTFFRLSGSAVPRFNAQAISQSVVTLTRRDPSWKRGLRYLYLRLLRLQSTPQQIARGLAVGVFAGCFPIFGFQTLAALVLAVPFRGNKLVAAAGTWVSNPFTYVPIYAFNYQVGQWLLGSQTSVATTELVAATWQSWMQWGIEVSGTLFLGCAFVGFWGSLVSYFLGLWLVRQIRRRRLGL